MWVVATANSAFIIIAALYDVVLIFVAAMDLFLSPRPRDFEIERSVAPRMNLGGPNAVTLRVRSRARLPVELILRDDVGGGLPSIRLHENRCAV